MRGLVYTLSIPKYLFTHFINKGKKKRIFYPMSCLSYKNVPEPELPGTEWIKIKTSYSGICGSDISALIAKQSFALEHYSSFPGVMGHENIGVVVETGSGVTHVKKGDRVYVDPVLGCEAKGLELCPECRDGRFAVCRNAPKASDTTGKGCITGYNTRTSGGWGEYFVAHRSQVFPIPDSVTDEQAVLVDSIASALQPVATHFPKESDTVVVYGCGIIGINTIACLRALGFKGKILAIYRYPFQGEIAREKGADIIIRSNVINEVSRITGAEVSENSVGKPSVEGGVDIIFDTIGNAGVIDTSLRLLRANGKYVMIAASGVLGDIDFTPVWFREITIVGSSMYSYCTWNGKKWRTYELAMELIRSGLYNPEKLVTHVFSIEDYKKAINLVLAKSKENNMKVVFKY